MRKRIRLRKIEVFLDKDFRSKIIYSLAINEQRVETSGTKFISAGEKPNFSTPEVVEVKKYVVPVFGVFVGNDERLNVTGISSLKDWYPYMLKGEREDMVPLGFWNINMFVVYEALIKINDVNIVVHSVNFNDAVLGFSILETVSSDDFVINPFVPVFDFLEVGVVNTLNVPVGKYFSYTKIMEKNKTYKLYVYSLSSLVSEEALGSV